MLTFYNVKHRYTKPFRPQTNGKIERFWKTIEEELLSNQEFETLSELKHHILGYNTISHLKSGFEFEGESA